MGFEWAYKQEGGLNPGGGPYKRRIKISFQNELIANKLRPGLTKSIIKIRFAFTWVIQLSNDTIN